MRKWLGFGILGAVLGVSMVVGGGGYYWLSTRSEALVIQRIATAIQHHVKNVQGDGNAEPSDVIEPLVVHGQVEPPADEPEPAGEPARTELRPGMEQPPRPDAETGGAPRMPMADEEQASGIRLLFDWNTLRASLLALCPLKQADEPGAGEESETTEPIAPADPVPVRDYHEHEQHCPYSGPCPSPYRYGPRD